MQQALQERRTKGCSKLCKAAGLKIATRIARQQDLKL